MRVLVVDSIDSHEEMDRRLRGAGYEQIAFATSPTHAVRMLGDGASFDLVLLGLEPNEELDACRRMRRALHDVPLVAIGKRPSEALIDVVLDAGAEDYVGHPVSWTELLARMRLALKRKSSEDVLTGLGRRSDFDAALRYEWRSAARARTATPLAVILADIDQLDVYNMRHGYDHGDRCLQDVAKMLSDAVRHDGDLVVRWDADAFAMLIPEGSLDAALSVAEHARAEIAKHGRVTASFGVSASVPRANVDPSSVVQRAEDALQHVKETGGNRALVVEGEPSSRIRFTTDPHGMIEAEVSRRARRR